MPHRKPGSVRRGRLASILVFIALACYTVGRVVVPMTLPVLLTCIVFGLSTFAFTLPWWKQP
jgi:hypothetical protein